jgi:hypothetical protein
LARSTAAAAAAGVAAAVPLSGTAAAKATQDEPDLDVPDTAGDVVAHVRDVKTGEIAVFTGEAEVTVHDRQLAARLARASSKKG